MTERMFRSRLGSGIRVSGMRADSSTSRFTRSVRVMTPTVWPDSSTGRKRWRLPMTISMT